MVDALTPKLSPGNLRDVTPHDRLISLLAERSVRRGTFTLEDFLEQMRAMKKLGPLENIVGMLPGGAQALKTADLDKGKNELRRMEGMICGMTPSERANPAILNASRRKRIAKGSGASVAELNTLLNKFAEMQKMMKQMSGGGMMGKMNAMREMAAGGGMPNMSGASGARPDAAKSKFKQRPRR